MKVFKFGGASVSNVERVKSVAQILQSYKGEKLLVVVSAMGKTTNSLEKVAEAFYYNDRQSGLQLFEVIKQNHLTIAKYLLVKEYNACYENLLNFFTEVEWMLHDKPVRNFDYYYDQIVCIGELLSSAIVSSYLKETGFKVQWKDVRDVFRTDDNFRDASIDWHYTHLRISEDIVPLYGENEIVLTQGFIGSTNENESATLGREGSDYSAAVFASMLDAESLTIWKDVPGVMNADPKSFAEAIVIPELNYDEVIEMAYYGAQVIHQKTIKPLQNKGIPLYVRSFIDPNLVGTVIHTKTIRGLPPIIVIKKDQALLRLHTKDFSFVGEKPIAELYQLLADIRIKPNLVQSGAVHISICLDDMTDKIERLALAASVTFDVAVEKDLQLLTIRHFNEQLLQQLITGKHIELRQESRDTVQVLMR